MRRRVSEMYREGTYGLKEYKDLSFLFSPCPPVEPAGSYNILVEISSYWVLSSGYLVGCGATGSTYAVHPLLSSVCSVFLSFIIGGPVF